MKYATVTLLILTVLALSQCRSGSENSTATDGPAMVDTAAVHEVADRMAEIQKCASCHPKVYENWLKGPHANAYRSIKAHIELVGTSSHFTEAYRHYLYDEADLNVRCFPCHTGSNVWETNLKGLAYEQDTARFKKEFYPRMLKSIRPRNRDNPDNMLTSVDCLSCHKSGKHVVTGPDFKPSETKKMEGQCSPVASPFYAKNESCWSCHIAQVRSMKRFADAGVIDKEIACTSSCHQEHDAQGKPTHYFYWRHDADDKTRPADHHLFNNITASVAGQNGHWSLHFKWGNNFMPHEFSACGEAVVITEVWDKQGKKLAELTERANLKDDWLARDTAKSLRDGIAGDHFIYMGTPITDRVEVKGDPRGGKVVIRGSVKPQYWSSAAELKETYRREEPINVK